MRGEDRTEPTTPDPDDPRKPDDPGDLTKRSWFYVLRKTLHEFSEDQCTDLAAALTYYAVLSIFPAMLALISVLGRARPGAQRPCKTVEDTLRPLVSTESLDVVDTGTQAGRPARKAPVSRWSSASLAALWSASGYVGAFGRAMNRIYEIDEGRPFWKLRR